MTLAMLQQSPINEIAAERSALVERLKGLISESLELELESDEMDEDTPLFGVGLALDSIDALRLVMAVESEFDVIVPPEGWHILRSVNTIADFLVSVDEGASSA